MHFQPLEDIAENLEESGCRHPNMALFNRLLSAAPSPTGLMGGALCRTSAHLQRLRHSPSIDQCNSDDEDNESCKVGKGGSLPLGLGQETESTVCSFREEKSSRTPLLDIQFGLQQGGQGKEIGVGENGDEETGNGSGKGESTTRGTRALEASLLPPPPQTSPRPTYNVPPTSRHPSVFPFTPAAHSSLEHCSSQPAINQNRAAFAVLKSSFGGKNMSFLAVPSYNEPQRFRSVSMGSELTGS